MPDLPRCILFSGLGGAGQRHLRLLRELLPETKMIGTRRTGKTPVLNPDFTVKINTTLEDEYGIQLLPDIEEAYSYKPDLCVIATPTAFHEQEILKALSHGSDVLVEKPGATSANQANNIATALNAVNNKFMVSFQRRFHPLVRRMKEFVGSGKLGQIMSVRVAIASHVPDWHPYEDFKELYACKSELGGGVLRTEIHEIDIITWLFGSPVNVFATGGVRGPYKLDVEDCAELLLDYKKYSVLMSLSFMQKKQERRFYIAGRDGWLELDLIAQRLEYGIHESGESAVVSDALSNDDMFREQARYFLYEHEKGDRQYINSLVQNMEILESCFTQMNYNN